MLGQVGAAGGEAPNESCLVMTLTGGVLLWISTTLFILITAIRKYRHCMVRVLHKAILVKMIGKCFGSKEWGNYMEL